MNRSWFDVWPIRHDDKQVVVCDVLKALGKIPNAARVEGIQMEGWPKRMAIADLHLLPDSPNKKHLIRWFQDGCPEIRLTARKIPKQEDPLVLQGLVCPGSHVLKEVEIRSMHAENDVVYNVKDLRKAGYEINPRKVPAGMKLESSEGFWVSRRVFRHMQGCSHLHAWAYRLPQGWKTGKQKSK